MKTIDVIFSSDDTYAQYLGVTLCSIFENKESANKINIYVIDGGILKDNKKKLEILENKYGFKISYISINKDYFKDLYISDHISHATYYRILIPTLFKEKVKKILYLDCDLIVQCDLSELFEKDVSNYYVGAVEDSTSETKEVLGLNSSDPYFNAGVLLINIEKWNNSDLVVQTFKFIRENPDKIKFWDQDALNYILKNKWLTLDKRFNFFAADVKKEIKYSNLSELKNCIIHFSGNIKPWNFAYNGFGKALYQEYLKKTPWRGEKCKDVSIKNLVKKIIFIFLSEHSIKKLIKIKDITVVFYRNHATYFKR